MSKDITKPEYWNKLMQRAEVQQLMRKKIQYKGSLEKTQAAKAEQLVRKQRRYELMDALMQSSTAVKHLVSPMFRYKITQKYLWKVYEEAKREGKRFPDKIRTPQVYHRLQAIKAEITAGPFGVAGEAAAEEVEEDLMDRFVVEADCIPGGVNGEAPERKQVLDAREMAGVLEFGQQIKREGNEAFQDENWEGAYTRYCQGDELLNHFLAEPHLEQENKELKTLWRQCLNNKANAALKTDQWQAALKASEDALKIKQDDEKALFRKAMALEGLGKTDLALEALDEIEEIANDMEPEHRAMLMDDVTERRQVIKDIDKKAAKDFSNMFKAMGDKKVFGEGRFLPDGTSPSPKLTDEQKKKIKQQEEREMMMEHMARQHRIEQGLPPEPTEEEIAENRRIQNLPNPPRPMAPRSVELTHNQAENLLDELLTAYSDPNFQTKVHKDAKSVHLEFQPFMKKLKKTAFKVQQPILAKWGFDESEEGLQEMLACLQDHTAKDKELKKKADECVKMLYGGENGMYGITFQQDA